jgi:tetratricopeptide (TPR) repeat protein
MKIQYLARILVLFAVATSMSGLNYAQSSSDKKKAKAMTEQGDKAFRAKNFAEAARAYGDAAVLVPSSGYAHFWKANAHYELKEYAEAEKGFAMALAQGFKPFEIYKVRWYMFYDQQNYDAAIADLNKALEVEPRNTLLLNGLGDSLRLKKMYPQAIAAYKRSVTAAPKDGDPHFYLARIYAETGDPINQTTAAEEAIRRGTRLLGETYYLLADGLQRQKKWSEAVAAYEKAIAAAPLKYEPYRNLAAIHQRQGRLKDAIVVMERARAAIHGEGRIFTELAWYYSLADRHTDAVGSANGAIKLRPAEYLGYTNLCRALNDTKQYQAAITACNNALRLNPGDGETYLYLGRASDFLKRTAEATRYYRLAVTGLLAFVGKNPEYPEGHYLLGNAYFADGQRDRAVMSFQKAVELNPNFSKARSNLGRIYVALGNKAAALEQHRALVPLDAGLAAQLKAAIDKM